MRTDRLTDKLRAIIIPATATSAALFLLWGGYRYFVPSRPSPTPTPPAPTLKIPLAGGPVTATIDIPPVQQDSDTDGLPDALEVIYKTDPYAADTDHDGYVDGKEVANGYDPTIPSPNDKLPLHASPGPTPTPAPPTLTQQFFTSTGLPPSRETLTANEGAVTEFVNETNARGYLPAVSEKDLHIINASGKAAISRYLDAISIPQNPSLHAVSVEDITTAFEALTKTRNAGLLDAIITDLAENVEALKRVEVPREAVSLHTTYLAASIALLDNTRALKSYETDYVGALVAASRIQGLSTEFDRVEQDIQALEKKYTIT